MAVKRIVTPERFVGLSVVGGDTKPTDGATPVRPGATYYEYDTKDLYITYDGTTWSLKEACVGYAEDTAHTSADEGILLLGVRSDTAAALAGTTGDYQPFIFDANGRLHVLDQNSAAIAASLALIDNAIPSGNELQVDVVASLPAGTALLGKVGIDQATANANEVVLKAGTAAIGKIGHDTTSIGHGVMTVTTAGSDLVLASSTACKWVQIQAQTDNTNPVAVGATGVDATLATGTGIILYPGESITLLTDNLADIFVDSITSGEGVRYIYGI